MTTIPDEFVPEVHEWFIAVEPCRIYSIKCTQSKMIEHVQSEGGGVPFASWESIRGWERARDYLLEDAKKAHNALEGQVSKMHLQLHGLAVRVADIESMTPPDDAEGEKSE